MPTPWTSPRVWTPYEPVTQSLLNTYLRNQMLSVSFLSTRFVTSDTSLTAVTLNLPPSSEALNAEIHVSGQVEAGGDGNVWIQFNASTSGYFRETHRFGAGVSTAFGTGPDTAAVMGVLSTTAGSAGYLKIVLPRHNGDFNAKTAMCEHANFLSTASTDSFIRQSVAWNQSTVPITTVRLFVTIGAFSSATEFSVYGMP